LLKIKIYEKSTESQKLKEALDHYKSMSEKLTEENAKLEEEIMLVRNNANSHLYKKSQKLGDQENTKEQQKLIDEVFLCDKYY